MSEYLLNAFATLLVTIDPIGLAPIFLAVTRGLPADMRRSIALRACVIASSILIVFSITGTVILGFLGISLPAFKIAGGLLLFWIAFEMVFEKREKRKQASAEQALAAGHGLEPARALPPEDMRHIAVFPLAIPLIAGPGAISASILLASRAPGIGAHAGLIFIIAGLIASCLLVFIAAEKVDKYLGETGRSVLTRLLGVILSALAVQFVADGIKVLIAA